jgi:hypothetical protein
MSPRPFYQNERHSFFKANEMPDQSAGVATAVVRVTAAGFSLLFRERAPAGCFQIETSCSDPGTLAEMGS